MTTDDNAAGGTGKGAANASGAKGPDELRQQIQQTRSQLGDTVEELAGKVDVKSRARARAGELKDRAGTLTVQLKDTATQAGHTVQDRAAQAGHTVQDKAVRAGHTVQDRAAQAGHTVQDKAVRAGHTVQDKAAQAGHTVQDRAAQAGHTVQDNVPRPVRAAATTVVQAGLRHRRPVLFAGAGAVLAAGLLWRRHHGKGHH
ncbi:DUF3618 domain-containing protein [Streptomyces sp. NPDC058249]|uniref:DUF3618 domain-containing protein n=1 Tax=Streptomyces sp. NPDC058249 TaxID=3346403 RepID=UPI0036E6E053